MNRWTSYLLILCLLLAPAATAETQATTTEEASGETAPAEGGESPPEEPAPEGEPAPEEGSDDISSFIYQDGEVADRCILYEWAGPIEDAKVQVNPVLGILVITPMNCIEELLEGDA